MCGSKNIGRIRIHPVGVKASVFDLECPAPLEEFSSSILSACPRSRSSYACQHLTTEDGAHTAEEDKEQLAEQTSLSISQVSALVKAVTRFKLSISCGESIISR